MRLVNHTNIDAGIIQNIARRAGISGPIRIIVRYDRDLTVYGRCIPGYRSYTIVLRDNYDIATLAHELKHIYYYTIGRMRNTGGEEASCIAFEQAYR